MIVTFRDRESIKRGTHVMSHVTGQQLGNCEGHRGLVHKTWHTKSFPMRVLLGVIFFRFNGRNVTGIFRISLLSSLMMIISISYKQKGALFTFLRKGQVSRSPGAPSPLSYAPTECCI